MIAKFWKNRFSKTMMVTLVTVAMMFSTFAPAFAAEEMASTDGLQEIAEVTDNEGLQSLDTEKNIDNETQDVSKTEYNGGALDPGDESQQNEADVVTDGQPTEKDGIIDKQPAEDDPNSLLQEPQLETTAIAMFSASPAIEAVTAAIEELPEVDNVLRKDAAQVEAAFEAFQYLSPEDQALVSNADKLTAVKDKLTAMQGVPTQSEKWSAEQPAKMTMSPAISSKMEITKYKNDNPNKGPVAFSQLYTIGEEASGDLEIDIDFLEAFYQYVSMPGDQYDFSFQVENQSKHTYAYEDGSLIVATPITDSVADGQTAVGFNGQAVPAGSVGYRTKNAALEALYGHKLSNKELTNEVLYPKLQEAGYRGENLLTQYYLDFYGNGQIDRMEDLSVATLNQLFGGNNGGVFENEPEIVALCYNWFYNGLFYLSFDREINTQDPKDTELNIGAYMRNTPETMGVAEKQLNKTLGKIAPGAEVLAANVKIGLSAPLMVNNYFYFDFGGIMGLRLKQVDGSVVVNKVDANGQKIEKTAGFQLYRIDNGVTLYYDGTGNWTETVADAATLATENGSLQVDYLLPGTYYLKETQAPAGYRIAVEPMEIVLAAGQTLTVDVANAKKSSGGGGGGGSRPDPKPTPGTDPTPNPGTEVIIPENEVPGGAVPEENPIVIPDDQLPAGALPKQEMLMELEDEEIPGGPVLPKTGGMALQWIYGLGALLTGGGFWLKKRNR